MPHMVKRLKNMTNQRELKTAKTGNNIMATGSLLGECRGYHKIYGKGYLVTYTDTAYIQYLSVNIFSLTRALTKGFNVTPEK